MRRAGPERNRHLDAPPLMMTETRGATPFRLDLHSGDVGHAFVVGPTGSGKSVLLSLLAMQFRRFIGAQVDLAGLASAGALLILLGVTAVAVVTKFVGALIGALREGIRRAVLIGWGMVPRGEVGIVVAGLGLSAGAIDSRTYSAVVGMAIITTSGSTYRS